jgi:serine/threonine-protein kinase
MAIVSSGALLDALRQHNLLHTSQVPELLALANGRCHDVRGLAKTLIQKGWYTVFQMNQVIAGHGQDLCVGPYLVLDRLGKGGQSEVYKAQHLGYNWTVALKVVRAEHLSSPDAANQFLMEMQAMADLDHPNIVQFLDTDKADDRYYCAMEFVDGTDLGKVVRLQGYLPVPHACEYARQTALGLQHAHEFSLIHRDIKPVNLYLTQQRGPVIKILDWGLAGLRPPGEEPEHPDPNARPTSILGTADFLSPEQALDPFGVDIRGDIYSLGCTLYYLLSGRPPFDGKTVMQKVVQHQTQEAAPVEALNPEVPLGLAGVLRRMMAKKREDRFQTPAAVALALQPFCRGDVGGPSMRPRQHTSRRHEDTPLPSGTIAPR